MAVKQPKRAIKLFGTEMPEPKVRMLTAGAVSAVLDNGALRYIKLGDIEVLRAIAFLVRDENWGTFNPAISNLTVKQSKTGFSVSYDARCADAKRALAYRAEMLVWVLATTMPLTGSSSASSIPTVGWNRLSGPVGSSTTSQPSVASTLW